MLNFMLATAWYFDQSRPQSAPTASGMDLKPSLSKHSANSAYNSWNKNGSDRKPSHIRKALGFIWASKILNCKFLLPKVSKVILSLHRFHDNNLTTLQFGVCLHNILNNCIVCPLSCWFGHAWCPHNNLRRGVQIYVHKECQTVFTIDFPW